MAALNNAAKQYTDAIEAFRKAANEGFGPAQIDLGGMYWLGRGVPRNYAEAVRWNRLAADQEIAPAQFNLGSAYEHGQGVGQNSEMAANQVTPRGAYRSAGVQTGSR